MGFEIETIDGSYRVKVSDEPSWVTGLQSGDDITAVGNIDCLVVAFSVGACSRLLFYAFHRR